MNLTIISLILTSLLTSIFQGPSKVMKVGHWKDEPAEIVSVKLRGRTLNHGDSLDPYPNWTKDLEITVRNVSDRPISYASVELSTSNDSGSDAIALTLYSFGSIPGGDGVVQYLKPNETALLTYQWTTGNPLDPRPADIDLRVVFWNNDKMVQWRAGRLLYFIGDGRYVPKPKSVINIQSDPKLNVH